MELQLVQKLVPLPDEAIRAKVISAFDPVDYERNYERLVQWFEDETQTICDANYRNQVHVMLRGAKNNYVRALTRLRHFLVNKECGKFPEWYQYYDLQGKYLQFAKFYVLCQPGITSEGYRITCMGLSSAGMENFDADILFKSFFMIDHLGLCLGHSYFLGVITIIDCRHITARHALKILSWAFRRYAKFQSEILPYRLVQLHMINVPKYIEKFVQIGRAFVSEKLRSRFCVEQSDTKMRHRIPSEFLPSDYGGHGEPLAQQCAKWFKLLQTLRPWYEAEQGVRLRPQNATTGVTTGTKRAQRSPKQTCCEDTQNGKTDEELVGDMQALLSKPNLNASKTGAAGRNAQKLPQHQNETTEVHFNFNNLDID